jgi:hypothetical protein
MERVHLKPDTYSATGCGNINRRSKYWAFFPSYGEFSDFYM